MSACTPARVRRLRGDAKALTRRHGRLALAVAAVDVAVEAAVGHWGRTRRPAWALRPRGSIPSRRSCG